MSTLGLGREQTERESGKSLRDRVFEGLIIAAMVGGLSWYVSTHVDHAKAADVDRRLTSVEAMRSSDREAQIRTEERVKALAEAQAEFRAETNSKLDRILRERRGR